MRPYAMHPLPAPASRTCRIRHCHSHRRRLARRWCHGCDHATQHYHDRATRRRHVGQRHYSLVHLDRSTHASAIDWPTALYPG